MSVMLVAKPQPTLRLSAMALQLGSECQAEVHVEIVSSVHKSQLPLMG